MWYNSRHTVQVWTKTLVKFVRNRTFVHEVERYLVFACSMKYNFVPDKVWKESRSQHQTEDLNRATMYNCYNLSCTSYFYKLVSDLMLCLLPFL